MTGGVRALLADPAVEADPEAALSARLARGERVPGFGHPLYPDDDPRAAALLAALPHSPPQAAVIAAMRRLTGVAPNVDFALVALESRLGLPHGAAFALFATGRSAGWIAHALEQWRDGRLIRPRAAFRDAAGT
jgi:citrate synthase